MKNPLLRGAVFAAFLFPFTVCAQIPSDVPGLQLWLDARDAATITLDGGFVSQWADKSGNGYHATQSDPDRRPVVEATAVGGSIPAIRFDTPSIAGDATTDGLVIDSALSVGNGPYSIFIVDQYWGAIQQRTLQGQNANWLIGKWRGANAHYSGAFNGPNNSVAGTGVAAIGHADNAGASAYRLNGDFFGRSGGVAGPGNLQIGSSGTSGANPPFDEYSQADVAEILVYDRVLTDAELEQVASYLHGKFGIGERPLRNVNATRSVPFTGADPGEGLDFSGTFVAAVNATGPGGLTIGDANFTDDSGVIVSENSIGNWAPAPDGFSGSADDDTLNTIMQSIRWTGTDGGVVDDVTAGLSGLVVGNTYKLQMLFGETSNARHFSVTVNGDLVVEDFLEAGQSGSTESRGVALIHEFVAVSETLDVILDGGNVAASGDINPLIQALTLEDRGNRGTTVGRTFNSAADLDFSGTFVYAVNLNGPGGFQIGDAVFTDESGVTVTAENALPDGSWVIPDYGPTSDDDNLETVMRSIRWTATNGRGEGVHVNVPGLTAGQNYKLQLLFDENSNGGRGFDIMVDGVLVADDFSTAAAFGSQGGVVLTHTFEAGDTDLDVLLDGFATTFIDRNPILAGFTLEETDDDGDTDNDGLPDDWERTHFTNLDEKADGDPDGDNLTNIEELNEGTDPDEADIDMDSLNDDVEIANGTDPYDDDSDDDLLKDNEELFTYMTDPNNPDTDLDFLPDGEEVAGVSDPLILDTDGDGFSDKVESDAGSLANDAGSIPADGTYVGNFTGGDLMEGLDLEGTFLYAVNVGTNGAPGIVRDADFTDDSVAGVSITSQFEIPAWNGAVNLGGSGNDAALSQALTSIRWSSGVDAIAPDVVSVTLSNLTVGSPYKLQLLFGEACCPNRGFDVIIDGVTVADDFRPGVSQNNPRTATGALVTHTFNATAVTMSIELSAASIADPGITDLNPILNAFTLEALPATGGLEIAGIYRSAAELLIEFNGINGKTYSVDYKPSLDSPFWEEVSDGAVSTGAGSEWVDPDPLNVRFNAPEGFYRIRDPVLQPFPN